MFLFMESGFGSMYAGTGKLGGTVRMTVRFDIFSSVSNLGMFTCQVLPNLVAISEVSYSIINVWILSFPTTLWAKGNDIVV